MFKGQRGKKRDIEIRNNKSLIKKTNKKDKPQNPKRNVKINKSHFFSNHKDKLIKTSQNSIKPH